MKTNLQLTLIIYFITDSLPKVDGVSGITHSVPVKMDKFMTYLKEADAFMAAEYRMEEIEPGNQETSVNETHLKKSELYNPTKQLNEYETKLFEVNEELKHIILPFKNKEEEKKRSIHLLGLELLKFKESDSKNLESLIVKFAPTIMHYVREYKEVI